MSWPTKDARCRCDDTTHADDSEELAVHCPVHDREGTNMANDEDKSPDEPSPLDVSDSQRLFDRLTQEINLFVVENNARLGDQIKHTIMDSVLSLALASCEDMGVAREQFVEIFLKSKKLTPFGVS